MSSEKNVLKVLHHVEIAPLNSFWYCFEKHPRQPGKHASCSWEICLACTSTSESEQVWEHKAGQFAQMVWRSNENMLHFPELTVVSRVGTCNILLVVSLYHWCILSSSPVTLSFRKLTMGNNAWNNIGMSSNNTGTTSQGCLAKQTILKGKNSTPNSLSSVKA